MPAAMRRAAAWITQRPHPERVLGPAIAFILLAGVVALPGERPSAVTAGAPTSGDTWEDGDLVAPEVPGATSPETDAAAAQDGVAGESSGTPGPAGRGPRGAHAGGARAPSTAANAGSACPVTFAGCGTAQGVTDKALKLGFVAYEGADQFIASIGGDDFSAGNGRRIFQALVDDVNRRGGIAGRTVTPFIYTAQIATTDRAGSTQAMCTALTEDQHVFAAILPEGLTELSSCLAKRHTLAFNPPGFIADETYFKREAPWVHFPSDKSVTRTFRTLLPVLRENRWFWQDGAGRDVKPKVGLVVIDRPIYTPVADGVVRPYLRDIGVPVEEYRVALRDNAELADLQSQTQQAVLRFKAAGVTHVLQIPGPFIHVFMQNSENQQFRPRYAAASDQLPTLAAANEAPRVQLRGMLGIGWRPQADVPDAAMPYTAQERRCFDVLRRGGERVTTRAKPFYGLLACDAFWAFEAAATRAGRTLTAGAVVAGLRELGASWPSVTSFRSDFGRGTFDASWAHRVLAWREGGCGKQAPDGCFEYRGPVAPD